MNSSSALFAASAWTWLWTALVVERASSVVWGPIGRWAAANSGRNGSIWPAAVLHLLDIGLGALCILVLHTAPPLDGLLEMHPTWLSVVLSALAMAGFIGLWRRLIEWPLKSAAPTYTPPLSLSSTNAGSQRIPSLPISSLKERRSFQLGSLSLHRSKT